MFTSTQTKATVILQANNIAMLNNRLANLYERDVRKLMEEVNLFKNEEDIWKTHGSVKNASGNLVLHIIGGLNHLIGTILGQTGYVRNRDQEFTSQGSGKRIFDKPTGRTY